jgi:putative FmdB family regulatory protein
MPVYQFRCPHCETEFEVSRPMQQASDPAHCPLDDTVAERVYTAPYMALPSRTSTPPKPGSSTPKPPSSGGRWSHHGHSHGPGAGSHSH